MNIRVGYGFDVHRLKEGEQLWLGGVLIPFEKGTVAYSDGDVLIHAICDALLGAAKLRDIGYHFPDSSEEYRNIDSKNLLSKTIELLAQNGYQIINIDTTVCLQKPKLSSYIPEMEEKLAQIMDIDPGKVSVKATTTEKLGFEGREEGVSVHSVVLIEKVNN